MLALSTNNMQIMFPSNLITRAPYVDFATCLRFQRPSLPAEVHTCFITFACSSLNAPVSLNTTLQTNFCLFCVGTLRLY